MSRENAVVPAPPDVRGPERCTFLGLYRVQSLCVALERGSRRRAPEWYEFNESLATRACVDARIGSTVCVIDLDPTRGRFVRIHAGPCAHRTDCNDCSPGTALQRDPLPRRSPDRPTSDAVTLASHQAYDEEWWQRGGVGHVVWKDSVASAA